MSSPKIGWSLQNSAFNNLKESQETTTPHHLIGISSSERLGSLYETGLYSDCRFKVEDTEIKAHKIILAAASPKMERVFLGAEVTEDAVLEVEFSLRVMQLVLKHVYLQDMDIESIEEAQDVIEAAVFFEMKDLIELCCAGIEPETLDDLWPALNLACMYHSRTLKESCLTLALKHSSNLLNHPGLIQASPAAFSCLLSREVIQIESELQAIECALQWAETRLSQATEETDKTRTIRSELEECKVLKHLRVLSLGETEFVEFIREKGKLIFTEVELNNLEFHYYSDCCAVQISPIRAERLLETRIPICGTDYLAVNDTNSDLEVRVRIYTNENGVKPVIKAICLPSQINPANILYDNVCHRTHYEECVLVENRVKDKVTSRGAFCERIKYSDDIHVTLNTFNMAPIYAGCEYDEDNREFYEAKLKIQFKRHGYYPLAVETKGGKGAAIVLEEPSRFVHEFVLVAPPQ